MKYRTLTNSRRNFVKGVSTLIVTSKFGLNQFGINRLFNSKTYNGMEVIDKEVVFVGDEVGSSYRLVPDEFIFSQYRRTPEVPDTMTVDYSSIEERCTTGVIKGLTRFGAINEGVYAEGKTILQIIASTPGTPDTGSGSPLYKNWYRLSTDGGETFSDFKLIVLQGSSDKRPIKEVEIGRNGYTMPFTCPIVKGSNGEVLVPVNLHPWDSENNKIYNPADAFLFGDSGVLIGNWTADKKDIKWHFGDWLRIDHRLSTRGLFEPSITELSPAGTFAMVMRGSNFKRPELPGYAWLSYSSDYCRTWSKPKPFTYSDGTKFYVPASCSTLFRSKHTDVLYWIGNVVEDNPYGNHPRNPLVIGRVDEKNFGLIRNSIIEIDHRHSEIESKNVELSNFKIMQHSKQDEIVVAFVRRIDGKWANQPSWIRVKLD